MLHDDLLTSDKEKARAKAEIRRLFTRLAIFAALCWVLFGSALGFSAFCAVFALLALVLSAGLWYVLNTWGARRFSAL
mgnify:CR=1 FL=1